MTPFTIGMAIAALAAIVAIEWLLARLLRQKRKAEGISDDDDGGDARACALNEQTRVAMVTIAILAMARGAKRRQ